MKNIALFLLVTLTLLSCNNKRNDNTNVNSTTLTDNKNPNEITVKTDTVPVEKVDISKNNKNEPVIDKPINVSMADFNEKVIKSDKIVLVDFWAQWCGPCKMIAPTLKEIAKEYAGKVIVAKVDVDNNQELASTYAIHSIPTLLYFKNGKNMDKVVGANLKQQYVEVIERLLNVK